MNIFRRTPLAYKLGKNYDFISRSPRLPEDTKAIVIGTLTLNFRRKGLEPPRLTLPGSYYECEHL